MVVRVIPIVPDEQTGRHTGLAERHVVAVAVVSDRAGDAQRDGHLLQLVGQRARAINGQAALAAHHVELEHGHGGRERVAWLADVVDGAPQPLLFRIPGGEEHGAVGDVARLLPGASDLQQRGHARGVVVGSVPHRAVGVAAHVIVVAADNHHLVSVLRVSAGDDAQHITAHHAFLLVERRAQPGTGGQLQALELDGEVGQRQPAALQQVFHHRRRDGEGGIGHGNPGLAVAAQAVEGAFARILPQQQPGHAVFEAVAQAVLVAAVAAEHHLAHHVQVVEVVVGAGVGPDHRSLGLALAAVVADQGGEIFTETVVAERRAIGTEHSQCRRVLQGDEVVEGEFLEVAAAVAGGLQVIGGEAFGDGVGSGAAACGAGAATSVGGVGQLDDVVEGLLLVEAHGHRPKIAGAHGRAGLPQQRLGGRRGQRR